MREARLFILEHGWAVGQCAALQGPAEGTRRSPAQLTMVSWWAIEKYAVCMTHRRCAPRSGDVPRTVSFTKPWMALAFPNMSLDVALAASETKQIGWYNPDN